MFGLGPGELLLLAAVIALVGGPSAIKKVFGWMQSAQKARSQLTGKALLGKLLEDEPDKAPAKKPSKKKRRT
jgi:Sec-independent protein translocase protein TatA